MTQITWSSEEERIQKLRVMREKRKERDMMANPEQRKTSQKIPGKGKEKSTGSTLNKVLMVGVEMACNQMVLHLFISLAQKVEPYRVDKWLLAMSTYITVASMFAPLGLDDIPGPEEATVEKKAKNSLLGIKSENGIQLCVCFASLVICRNFIPESGKYSSDLDLWIFSLVFFMHALLLLQGVENMGEVYWSQREASEELKRGIEVAKEVEVLKQAEASLGKFDIRRLVDNPIKTGSIFGLFILIMLMCHDLFLSMFSEFTLEAIELSVIVVAIGLQGVLIYKEYVGLARKTSKKVSKKVTVTKRAETSLRSSEICLEWKKITICIALPLLVQCSIKSCFGIFLPEVGDSTLVALWASNLYMIITRFYGHSIDDSFIVQNRKNSRKGLKATVPKQATVGSEDSHHWYDI